jgi:hypothetical protein
MAVIRIISSKFQGPNPKYRFKSQIPMDESAKSNNDVLLFGL